MKLKSIVRIAVLALPLLFSSCSVVNGIFKKSKKEKPMIEQRQTTDFVSQVRDNQQTNKFITSKVKFSVEVGPQKITDLLRPDVLSSPRITCSLWIVLISST